MNFDRKIRNLEGRSMFLKLASVQHANILNSWSSKVINEYKKPVDNEIYYNTTVTFPDPMSIFFPVKGGAVLVVDGEVYSGLDRYHTIVDISKGEHKLELYCGRRDLFGDLVPEMNTEQIIMFQRDRIKERIYAKMSLCINYVKSYRLENDASFIEKILNELPPFPIESVAYLIYGSKYLNEPEMAEFFRNIKPETTQKTPDLEFQNAPIIERGLDTKLKEYRKLLGNKKILPIGHAHIDLAWLWPVKETKRKIVRTTASVFYLSKAFGSYNFVQSMAWLYKFVEEYDLKGRYTTSVMKRIKELVAEGKWTPIGDMMVESDCNLLSGESLIRQIYYGKKYFKKWFGMESRILWLPDTFGFNGQMPQIMKETGYDLFVTTKISWNDTNQFPYDTFRWKGIDGTDMLAHLHRRTYNSDITPADLKNAIEMNADASKTGTVPVIFGYGDGGGGPTREMIENMKYMDQDGDLFLLKPDSVGDWISSLKKDEEELPEYAGELYLEYHRGTYTTHGEIKKANRELEALLMVREAMIAMNGDCEQNELEKHWDILLKNQFHDILPGSAIGEVYTDAYAELSDSIKELSSIDMPGNRPVLFNPFPWKTDAILDISHMAKHGETVKIGGVLGKEIVDEGIHLVKIPLSEGIGFYEIELAENKDNAMERDSSWEVNIAGDNLTIVHNGVECITPEFRLLGDFPETFDAWELNPMDRESGVRLKPSSMEFITNTKHYIELKVTYELFPGTMNVFFKFAQDDAYDLEFDVQWQGNNRALRSYFNTGLGDCRAGIPMGHILRKPEETNKFEFPVQRFINVNSSHHSTTILTRDKFGFSYDGKYIGCTLLRSPVYPDPDADRGMNRFSFRVLLNELDILKIEQKAMEFQLPVLILENEKNKENRIIIEGAIPSAIKKADDENGIIVRIFNPSDVVSTYVIKMKRMSSYMRCNMLEENIGKSFAIKDNEVRGKIKPFQIITLRIQTEQEQHSQ